MSHDVTGNDAQRSRPGRTPDNPVVVPARRLFLSEIAAVAAGAMLVPGAALAARRKPGKAKPTGPVPRSMRLYNPNTKESWSGVYHDGKALLPKAHEALNWFLRDHHEKKETHMDPATLDLLWRLSDRYRRVGHGKVTVNVNSAYRTKATNDKLLSEGAARNSQHLSGKAVDVTVQGFGIYFLMHHVERIGAGGVGLYWRGKFAHLDSGPRRYWYRR